MGASRSWKILARQLSCTGSCLRMRPIPRIPYNPTPRALDHRNQGRFEPADPRLGGYTYVSPTVAGAVAEGILRNQRIPASGLARRMWLTNKKIATLRLYDDIQVAAVY